MLEGILKLIVVKSDDGFGNTFKETGLDVSGSSESISWFDNKLSVSNSLRAYKHKLHLDFQHVYICVAITFSQSSIADKHQKLE